MKWSLVDVDRTHLTSFTPHNRLASERHVWGVWQDVNNQNPWQSWSVSTLSRYPHHIEINFKSNNLFNFNGLLASWTVCVCVCVTVCVCGFFRCSCSHLRWPWPYYQHVRPVWLVLKTGVLFVVIFYIKSFIVNTWDMRTVWNTWLVQKASKLALFVLLACKQITPTYI